MWEALCPGRDQPPVSSCWQCCLGTKCLCSLEWRDLGANVCGMLLNHKNQYPAWGMAFAGIFFQMSELENLCVCTHVLLPLVHCQPQKTTSFSHKLCLSPVPKKALLFRAALQNGGLWFPTSTLVYLWGEEYPSDCVISHREGPRAAKLEAADALDGFWRPPPHCGKGHEGFA